MCETIITSITQIITTLITVGVTILVAYLTYRSQKNKADHETEKIQEINLQSSLDLFRAYVSALVLFASPSKIQLPATDLLICIQKMKVIEEYLSELTETSLPDTFIENFRLYRLNLTFQRITLESRLKNNSGAFVDSSTFENSGTLELITSVQKFILEYSANKNPEGN